MVFRCLEIRESAMDDYEFNDEGEENPPSSARQWAMGCHLVALTGYFIPIASIVAPLVIWLLKREESAFIDDQGKESVNFQLSILIYFIVAILLIPLLGMGILLKGLRTAIPPVSVSLNSWRKKCRQRLSMANRLRRISARN
jgi:uncharacterized Tic20 family protein